MYCLYSTEDGTPKYVGQADQNVAVGFDRHVADALDRKSGEVNDWIRAVWARGHEVEAYTIQEGIDPKDLGMFEQYWIDQFAYLLNFRGDKAPRANSPYAEQITDAIQSQLGLPAKNFQNE